MKKQFAIFAFLIFFFSQFGRVINFCLCTAANYQHTKTFQCDCEKQLVANADDAGAKQPHANLPPLQPTDDLYHVDNTAAYRFTPFVFSTNYINGNSEALYNRYCGTIFHPPGQPA